MTYTIPKLLDSIAGVLTAGFPEYPVYTNINQQGTQVPCFFIALMPSVTDRHVGNRYFRDIGIDVIFLQERNIEDGNAGIQKVQEFLDYALDGFLYSDGTATAVVHAYGCEAATEDQELHYKFHIKQRVSKPVEFVPMQELEANDVSIKNNEDAG